MKNVPNILSAFRLILVPVFIAVFLTDYPNRVIFALFIFLFAGATDVVDGYIARKYQCISILGKILDPVADKLMQIAVIVCLYIKAIVPPWLLAIVVLKEIAMFIGGCVVIKTKHVVVVSSWFGKAAVCVFYLGVCYFIIGSHLNYIGTLDVIIISVIMGICAISAFVMYVYKYTKQINDLKANVTAKQPISNLK